MAGGQLDPDPFAARLIERTSTGFAGYAAERLLERHPETKGRFGRSAFNSWKDHLAVRLNELAAAIAAGEPKLFTSQVAWSRQAFETRSVPLDDLKASLECLREVLKEELPEEAAASAMAILNRGIDVLANGDGDSEPRLSPSTAEGKLALTYLEAVLQGERRRAMDLILDAVEGGLPVRSAYLDVLIPAQSETGRLWHANRLGVAEEHLISETTLSVMALLCHRTPTAPLNDRTVLTAGVPGNAHDLGLRVVADFFEIAGWRVIHLGPDVPSDEIAQAAAHFEVDVVALSTCLPTQIGQAAATVETIRKRVPEVKILIGGRAFRENHEVWRATGADAFAPAADDAVVVGGRLAGLP